MGRLAHSALAATLAMVCTLGATDAASAPAAPPGSGTLPDPWCRSRPEPPFCHAVRGDRAEGWAAQSRSEVMAPARHGRHQPAAGRAGGPADPACTAATRSMPPWPPPAVLSLTEPMMVGVASDLFAVIYVAKEHKIYVLNASGIAPSGATLEHFNELGYHVDPKNWGPVSGMPAGGILPVTVPGTVWGWQAVLKRFGTLTFKEVLEPAAGYARTASRSPSASPTTGGCPMRCRCSGCCTRPDPDSIRTWYVNGQPPAPGQIFRNPDLAQTFALLQAQGRRRRSTRARSRARSSPSPTALGGTMTLEDLANYQGEWVEPARTDVSRLRQSRAAAARAGVGDQRDAQHPQACVPQVGAGPDAGLARPGESRILAPADRGEEARLRRPVPLQRRSRMSSAVPLRRLLSHSYAASLCGEVRSAPCFDDRCAGRGGSAGRHHRAVDRR